MILEPSSKNICSGRKTNVFCLVPILLETTYHFSNEFSVLARVSTDRRCKSISWLKMPLSGMKKLKMLLGSRRSLRKSHRGSPKANLSNKLLVRSTKPGKKQFKPFLSPLVDKQLPIERYVIGFQCQVLNRFHCFYHFYFYNWRALADGLLSMWNIYHGLLSW